MGVSAACVYPTFCFVLVCAVAKKNKRKNSHCTLSFYFPKCCFFPHNKRGFLLFCCFFCVFLLLCDAHNDYMMSSRSSEALQNQTLEYNHVHLIRRGLNNQSQHEVFFSNVFLSISGVTIAVAPHAGGNCSLYVGG